MPLSNAAAAVVLCTVSCSFVLFLEGERRKRMAVVSVLPRTSTRARVHCMFVYQIVFSYPALLSIAPLLLPVYNLRIDDEESHTS
jgi:hypothetical protein